MKKRKVKLSKADLASIENKLGFRKAGVEYTTTLHNQNVYRSEVKQDYKGGVYR